MTTMLSQHTTNKQTKKLAGIKLKLRLSIFNFPFFPLIQQVALIAINVLGEYLSTENAMQLIQNMNNERTETALASICDDLSFSMYVEENIVETIRELEQKKLKAVNGNCIFFHDFLFEKIFPIC